ncbi:MAG: DUF2490 domain-containing protein [Flavobacteriales bacterium]|nr:DUF2490 domain-containing protein [Flavobacteriales bacterium]
MRLLRTFALLLLLVPMVSRAQERARPAIRQELWASFGMQGRPSFLEGMLGKSFTKKLRTYSELGYRSADSFFAGRQFYLDLGIGYKVNDHITVGTEGRYAYRSDDVDRQRLCALFKYETKVDRFDLGYRFDYQHNFRAYGDVREVVRNKFISGYNIPKWKLDPQFSVEFFTWVGNKGMAYFGTRYKLGTEFDVKKGHTIGVGVLHDRERMVYEPTYRFMFSVDYSINLRK